jgi:hypothetical protein
MDSSRVKSSRFLVAVALAVMLVFAQQAGVLHALSHLGGASDTTQPQKHHPGEKVCDHCLVFAVVHGGAPSAQLLIPVVDGQSHFHANEALSVPPRRAAHYRSRAPPALS